MRLLRFYWLAWFFTITGLVLISLYSWSNWSTGAGWSRAIGIIFIIVSILMFNDLSNGRYTVNIKRCVSSKHYFEMLKIFKGQELILARYVKHSRVFGLLIIISYDPKDQDVVFVEDFDTKTKRFTITKEGEKVVVRPFEPVKKKADK